MKKPNTPKFVTQNDLHDDIVLYDARKVVVAVHDCSCHGVSLAIGQNTYLLTPKQQASIVSSLLRCGSIKIAPVKP